MSENDIEKTKQEIVKIDELIVKKQKEMNELQKVLMIEPSKIDILGENYEELRNEIKELGDKLKEQKQMIQKK
tara:strand:+ start:389 stop:607 length:219 start_codon:yes stop_codon:yes gene_type:complete